MERTNSDHSSSNCPLSVEVEIEHTVRWDIYSYLQSLSIPCECKLNQPLRVQVETATVAIELWSLVQLFTSPKQLCIDRLERCWRQKLVEQ